MSVHIERAITEVVPQAEARSESSASEETPWQREARVLAALARQRRHARRTRAEGLDD